jgi:hypothetical protein
LFFRDTRILSAWQLRLDDEAIEPLAVMAEEPYHATFVGRAQPRAGLADSTLLVERQRFIGAGMREDIALRNLGREAAACTLTIRVEADFADLFEVKQGRIRSRGLHSVEHIPRYGRAVGGPRGQAWWPMMKSCSTLCGEAARIWAHFGSSIPSFPTGGPWPRAPRGSWPCSDGTRSSRRS